jgi:hypothetical protein
MYGCGQNIELFNGKGDGTSSYHCALKGNCSSGTETAISVK